MKQLVQAQNRVPGIRSILAVAVDKHWLASPYGDDIAHLEIPVLVANTMRWPIFGTGAFISYLLGNPVHGWLKQLRAALPTTPIILHSHSAWLTGAYLPVPEDTALRVVATFHGIADEHRLRAKPVLRSIHKAFAKRTLQHGAQLTSVASSTLEVAKELFELSPSAFQVIPNGLHCSASASTMVPKQNNCSFVVGFVGQLHPGKGWHFAAAACIALHRQGYKIKLIIAGAGQDENLVRTTAEQNSDCIEFLGFVREAGQVLMPRFDVLVLPSWTEGLPMVVLEAMAQGVLVIATPVGAVPMLIRDGQTGLLIERSSDSVAAALSRVIHDVELRQSLCREAAALVAAEYSIERVNAAYIRSYGLSQ